MNDRRVPGAWKEGALGIFVASLLVLFLEVMLIRWVSTEIRIFAYLQNTVLVVCFLGLGAGCLTCRRPFILRDVLLPLLALVLLLAIPSTRGLFASISERLSTLDEALIWFGGVRQTAWQTALDVLIGLALTLVVMVLIAAAFVPLGRLLGRLMDGHPRAVAAYSWNVLGSLVGVWLFVLLSALHQPPVTWFVVVVVLALLLVERVERVGRQRMLGLALASAIVGLSWLAGQAAGTTETVWSPYQKLAVSKPDDGWLGKYVITVNNAGFQGLVDQAAASSAADPAMYPREMRGFTQYDLPFLLHPGARSALLVGAGSGNDAAGALRHGLERITAVEIDPAIIALGRRYHPERPYDSRTISVVVDDARSFFARTHETYDVISFGLLDAHTTTAMTNARLDHYVYTRESLQRARDLLDQGGILTLTFAAQKLFIADRIARTLREVFGAAPMCFVVPPSGFGWGGFMFVAGDLKGARSRIKANPGLDSLITDWRKRFPVPLSYTAAVATDDWPYLYLPGPRIPVLYYLLGGLLLVVLILFRWRLKAHGFLAGWPVSHWHFFFLGAGFLLLEVQNISKASVVLGNTWVVNAVIISAVLIMILLANSIVVVAPKIPMGIVYALLCGSCLALFFVDLSRFAFMPLAAKALVVGALTCLPMLFSGIVFISSFRTTAERDAALGANLIGALVGALLQSVTFVTGIKVLLLLVAVLYFLAMLTAPKVSRDLSGNVA